MRRFFLIPTLLTAILSPVQAVLAKGVTVKISITGGQLSGPIDVIRPDVVSQFSIWSGPNSFWRMKDGIKHTDYSRIFADFPGGVVDPPADNFSHYNVEFHIAGTPDQPPWDETYRVRYVINSSEIGGYMYLPTGNPFIYHGVEGNWFHSSESWETLVRPIVEKALLQRQVKAGQE